ncbi:MAG: hypothetical protein D3923_18140 [Candidatus Electrothrix sp. AR3]|nr:hypothetical protein [Candidatus Electrothrix sp. AR3]
MNGFDVLAVLDDQGNGYYAFKAAVESREMIRDMCGSDDPAVIGQLERWWDKYRVSLRELDKQVEEAEGVMRGYLEELGYE